MSLLRIGVIDGVVVIPVVALKFGSVLLEHHHGDKNQDAARD